MAGDLRRALMNLSRPTAIPRTPMSEVVPTSADEAGQAGDAPVLKAADGNDALTQLGQIGGQMGGGGGMARPQPMAGMRKSDAGPDADPDDQGGPSDADQDDALRSVQMMAGSAKGGPTDWTRATQVLPQLNAISQAGEANFKAPGGMVPKMDLGNLSPDQGAALGQVAPPGSKAAALAQAAQAGAGLGGPVARAATRPAPLPVGAAPTGGFLEQLRRALAATPRGGNFPQ
jgi:hypothetical protein